MSDLYDPELPRIFLFPGDISVPSKVMEDVAAFTAASGLLIGPDDVDRTASYVNGSAVYSGNKLTAGSIGVGTAATIVPGEYKYYITGTYDGGLVRTWYWPVSVSAKLGGS